MPSKIQPAATASLTAVASVSAVTGATSTKW